MNANSINTFIYETNAFISEFSVNLSYFCKLDNILYY